MKNIKIAILIAASILFSGTVGLACGFKNTVPVNILTAGFEAWKVVTNAAAECGNFKAELDQDYKNKVVAAMSSRPSTYTISGVTISTILPLLGKGLIRPLDKYVAAYGKNLAESQKIRVAGKIMAIAQMVNAQHLFYRKDILSSLGIKVPKSYEEVIAAAEVIKKAKVVDYPLGGTFKSGWNLGEEFINMFLGMGGELYDPQTNQPMLNNAKGIATLKLLKRLTKYMDPEYLVSDSTYVQKQFQQGRIAMANLWASRAVNINDPTESKVIGKIGYAAAPTAKTGGSPATTLWWGGWAVAQNITEEVAEASFRVMIEAIDYKVLSAHPDANIWLSSKPIDSPIGVGAIASAKGGAPSYPASPMTGMIHGQAGKKIIDYLTGKKTETETLADIENGYLTSAKEAGYIK
jgi:multiple sugar transport system substrate-binding protein